SARRGGSARRQLDDSGTVSAHTRAFFANRLAAGGGPGWTQRGVSKGLGPLSVVRSEHLAQLVADLADRAARAERLAHRRQQVAVALGDSAHLGQRALCLVRTPLSPHLRRPLELAAL